jgi:hypothetical protein
MREATSENKTYRINLHMHTTDSDGRRSPEEAIAIYKAAGYDAVAITDHWRHGEEREIDGMKVFSGCEYNFGGNETFDGAVYHILSLFCLRDPGVVRADDPAVCIRKIHEAGGLAILAHPAWSLNQPDCVEAIQREDRFDATEIYNTVSGEKHSNRPYSGMFVDQMANRGILYPLFAADDVHYYEKDGTSSAIIVSLPELTREGLIEAIRNRDFYAVSGGKDAPYLEVRDCGNTIHIACSPVSEVNIFTNLAWAENRHLAGEDITEADYPCVIEGRPRQDRWIRVEVTDRDGRRAYSNLISKAEQIGE